MDSYLLRFLLGMRICTIKMRWGLLASLAAIFSAVSSEYSTTWMTSSMCETKLECSQKVMEFQVMESEERQIRVWRNNDEIFSGESYNPMEYLKVSVSKPGIDYLYEVHGAAVILNGTCDGSRIVSSGEILLHLPDHGDYYSDITIVAGWANKFDHVKMTSRFVIVHKEETRNKIAVKSDSQKSRFHELKKLLHSFSSFPESTETQNFVEEGEEEDIRSDTNLLMIESKEQVNGHVTSNVNNVPAVVSLMREARLAAASASASASGINDPKSKIQDDTQHHTVPDAPNLGELLDFRGSDRVVLSPSEKAKEMQKIRDRQLFGVHGQRVKRHKKHVLMLHTASDFIKKSVESVRLTYARLNIRNPLLILMGKVFACFPLAFLIFKVHSKRYRLFRCLWKKRGLL